MTSSTFFGSGIDVPTHLGLKRKRSQRSTARPHEGPEHDTCVQVTSLEIFRDFPRHKTAELRFITSICVKKFAPDDMAQRQCPLLECTLEFPDKESMCQHLYHCAHLSKGRYWCLDCRKGERVSKFHCKRCPSRASSVAKRFFSKLGPSSHRKENYVELDGGSAQAVEEQPWSDFLERSGMAKNQQDAWGFSPDAPLPSAASKPQTTWQTEAPGTTRQVECNAASWDIPYPTQCELPDSYICEMPVSNEPEIVLDESNLWDEKHNWWFDTPDKCASSPTEQLTRPSSHMLTQSQYHNFNQLSSYVAPTTTRVEQQQGYPSFNTRVHQLQNSSFAESQHQPRSWASPRPTLTCNTQNLPQINTQDTSPFSNPGMTDSPFVISPLSPENNTMTYQSWPTITISPTESEASANTLFSNSALSTSTNASSWNNSIATSPVYDFATDNTPDFNPFGVTVQRTSSNPWSSYMPISPARSTNPFAASVPATYTPTEHTGKADESRWSSTLELLHYFAEILEEQLQHSKAILKGFPKTPLVMDLLDLSPLLTASIGLEVLADLFRTGEGPNTVISIFAFTHIVYACTLTVQSRKPVNAQRLFEAAFKLVDALAVKEQRDIYGGIVKAIWRPSSETRLGRVVDADSATYLSTTCKDLLDDLEICARSTGMADFSPTSSEIRPHDELLFNIKTQIMGKLIPEFYADGLIEDLVRVEDQVKHSHIKDFRGVELALLRISKDSGRDDHLSQRLVSRVAELFDALYAQQNSSRMSYHLRDISKLKRLLDDDLFTGSDTSDDEDSAILPLQQIKKSVVAFSREADKTLVQEIEPKSLQPMATIDRSTSTCSINSATSHVSNKSPMAQSKLQPSSSPETPKKPKSKYRCACGYEPQGEERWKASNLARHRRTQHSAMGEVKAFTCPFAGCGSSFNRSDNLRMHRREKGHGGDMEVDEGGDVVAGTGRRKRQKQG
ncbi:hypothetical protein BP6252_04845 [Coleophoma cylindrospora]|uniref:C2H2-type domain-containing protein n=1 Tax=Coleophoma cylindrospora TaxID=1849047 RepID=A0A3D8S1N1_9HELO|nr:hypothetical protein BP6252_04845 [Coleophoma cylindrospora]